MSLGVLARLNPTLLANMVNVCDVICDEYFYSFNCVPMCHESLSSPHICKRNIFLKHNLTVKAILVDPDFLLLLKYATNFKL